MEPIRAIPHREERQTFGHFESDSWTEEATAMKDEFKHLGGDHVTGASYTWIDTRATEVRSISFRKDKLSVHGLEAKKRTVVNWCRFRFDRRTFNTKKVLTLSGVSTQVAHIVCVTFTVPRVTSEV